MEEFEEVAREQGWNNESIILHLKGFIEELDAAFKGTVSEALADYARKVQEEENDSLVDLGIASTVSPELPNFLQRKRDGADPV